MTFKEIYREILNFAPNVPALDAMKLINNAISELNAHNFVQEWEMKFILDTSETPSEIDLTSINASINANYNTQVIKVLNVLDPSNYALTRLGSGKEYIENVAIEDEKAYGQIGDKIYIYDNVGGSYTVSIVKAPTNTIVDDNGGNWSDYFSVGDYIYLSGTDNNDGAYQISSFSTDVSEDDTIDVDSAFSSLSADESGKAEAYVDPTYTVVAFIAIPQFTWNSGNPSVDVEVFDSYIPAIRNLALSTIYKVNKYNMKTPSLAEYYINAADNEIDLLEKTSFQYKEQRVFKRNENEGEE